MPSFIESVANEREQFEARLAQIIPQSPSGLYDPVRHVVAAGGKRVRPLLTALTYQLTRQDDGWIDAAIAIELLHTFTLVHDDIMDNAATRRGIPTVHAKFGTNEAILSGDVMIALAQQALTVQALTVQALTGQALTEQALTGQALTEQALAGQALAAQSLTGQSLAKSGGTHSPELLAEFALGFVKVCEGQAYDKEFEKRDKVTLSEYIEMIDLKTAKVLETAAVLGVIASGDYTYIEALRTFAHHVGIAFQIQDDLLDLTAEDAEFGKTIGGDILEGKRTYLLLKLVERQASLSAEARDRIDRILAGEATTGDIDPIRSTMQQSGVLRETEDAVQEHTTLALQALDEIGTDTSRLRSFAGWLLKRSH